MSEAKESYIIMMHEYMVKAMTTIEFIRLFIDKFKNKTISINEEEFLILDELFGDIDCYTDDANLLAGGQGFYIDECTLREKVAAAMKALT